VVERARPVRLTPAGRASLTGQESPGEGQAALAGRCPCCAGLGLVVPEAAAALTETLERAALGVPAVKLELDQTHCTADTKLRRVLAMHETGALAGQRILLLGDDDLVSVALAAVAAHVARGAGRGRGGRERPRPRRGRGRGGGRARFPGRVEGAWRPRPAARRVARGVGRGVYRPAVHGARGGAVPVPRGLSPGPGRWRARVLLLRPPPPPGDRAGPAPPSGYWARPPPAAPRAQHPPPDPHPCGP